MGRDDVPLIAMDSHAPGPPVAARRGADAAPRLQLHRRQRRVGRLDAGLFFLAYQRDVRTSFLPVQQMLARSDTLNEYIRHTGSAVFAVPPGVAEGRIHRPGAVRGVSSGSPDAISFLHAIGRTRATGPIWHLPNHRRA